MTYHAPPQYSVKLDLIKVFLRVCQTRYKLFPRSILGCTRFTALDVRVPSFTPTENTKVLLKITISKSPRNLFVLIIIIKMINKCVSKCPLHCLEKPESKYVEALVHSDGLTKHSVLLVWKTLAMKKICPLFICQKLCLILITNSLPRNAIVGYWIYSQLNFAMLWLVWLSQYWIYLPYPQIQECQNSCLHPL